METRKKERKKENKYDKQGNKNIKIIKMNKNQEI